MAYALGTPAVVSGGRNLELDRLPLDGQFRPVTAAALARLTLHPVPAAAEVVRRPEHRAVQVRVP